jgi:hypothetical protein
VDSILDSVKKNLGLADDYDVFDPDIILFINSVFSTLNQLGLGPANGFMIEDDTATWDQFLGGDVRFNDVKTYIYLRVRLLFDPPQTGYLVEALDKQIKELEWRMNVRWEDENWEPADPAPSIPDEEDEFVLDGGES